MSETLPLAGRVALVTGAAMGLGRSIAERLAAAGAAVVAADLDSDALEAAAGAGSFGDDPLTIRADVSSSDDVRHLFSRLRDVHGSLQIAVNNAGITTGGALLDLDRETWDRQLAVNATGTFLCTREAAALMIDEGYGRIVNMSSHSGLLGSAGRAAYAASKGAVNAFTRVAAVELAEHGITVNAVAPGPILTPHARSTHSAERIEAWNRALPISRYGDADEVAALVLFLASSEAGYITGQTISIDGGFTIKGLAPQS